MKAIKILFLLCLLVSSEIFAGGGSYYTRYGLGDFYYSYTARRLGMGELGIALIDHDFMNNLNPASWSNIRLTRFETGLMYEGTGMTSSYNSVFHSQTVFGGLSIGFPVLPSHGVSLVGGTAPYSNVSYDVSEQIDSNVVDAYKLTYQGSGGIQKAFLGLSYRLPFNFSLGSSFDYYYGKVNYKTDMNFGETTTFYDAAYKKDFSYHGIGFTVGLISSNLAGIFGIEELKDVKLGFTFSSPVNLSTDSVSVSTTVVGEIENSSMSYKTKLPLRLGLGLAMNWSDEYNFILDYLYQPMSQYDKNGITSPNMKDLSKFSFGFEYRKTRPSSQSFWEHVMFRGGLSFEQSQYTFEGEEINQFSVYTGFSMPIGFDSSLDFGFQYGSRGSTNNFLLKENIYKFSITLSTGELWFVREDR